LKNVLHLVRVAVFDEDYMLTASDYVANFTVTENPPTTALKSTVNSRTLDISEHNLMSKSLSPVRVPNLI
jgi:hypothetical protein